MPSTDIAYASVCLRSPYAMPSTAIPHAMTCLRSFCAMSGTDIAYALGDGIKELRKNLIDLTVTPATCLRPRYAMSGTDVADRRTSFRFRGTESKSRPVSFTISLRDGYAISCTEIVYRSGLRACYAMSGTDIVHA
eukprot:3936564-Rhodomonas_salina.1